MGLALDELRDDENAVNVDGLDILISDDVKRFADMSTIDFVSDGYRQGFTISIAGHSGC